MPQKKKKKKKKRSFKRSQPIVISPHREPILALLATFNALFVNITLKFVFKIGYSYPHFDAFAILPS